MAIEIRMPQLGESVTEGTIGRWLKAPGEQVARYEPLLEVVTDKVDTEVPAPEAGTLVEILVAEGETVRVGTVIARLGTAVDDQAGRPGDREAGRPGDREAGRPGDRETGRPGDWEAGRPGDWEAGRPRTAACRRRLRPAVRCRVARVARVALQRRPRPQPLPLACGGPPGGRARP